MISGPHVGFQYSQENNLAIFITWILATLAVTEFTYRTVEKPMMQKGRNFARSIESGEASLPWKKRLLITTQKKHLAETPPTN
jgi:peptidoglycan/LPS O-acetylase OafA/YrhL